MEKKFKQIYIEISNICNLACSFCPEVKREKQQLSLTDFTAILRKVKPHTEFIALHLMGEPLGHPHFAEVMDICAAEDVRIRLTTNAVLLSRHAKTLLSSPALAQINFSIQSFTDNFPAADAALYMRKLFAFVQDARRERPDLYVNFRLWDLDAGQQGLDENRGLRDLLEAEYGFKVEELKVDVRRKKRYEVAPRVYLHFDSRFEWPSLNGPLLSTRGRCHGLLSHVGVHADGTLVPCCLDKEAQLALGSLHDSELSTLLQGPRAVAMREGFAARKLVEPLCQRCSYITRF